jgi:hypothetical protein
VNDDSFLIFLLSPLESFWTERLNLLCKKEERKLLYFIFSITFSPKAIYFNLADLADYEGKTQKICSCLLL